MNFPDHGASLPVKAQYKYTADEVSKGLRAHLRYNSGAFKFIPILGWIMIFCSIVTLLLGKATVVSTIPTVLLGSFFILMNPFVDWQFRRRFRHNPNKDALMCWTFSTDTISSEGDGFNANFAWKKVFSFIDSPKGFLIYPQKQLFHWIPFSGFNNEAEIDRVRQIAKSEANNYKKVS